MINGPEAGPADGSLALWACQSAHEYLADLSSQVTDENRLRDRRRAPPLQRQGVVHTQYVDNFLALSRDSLSAEDAAHTVGGLLVAEGFPVHPVEASAGGTALGWTFDPSAPIVGISARAGWRLRLGLWELARRGYASGEEVSCVVGRYTFRALIPRAAVVHLGLLRVQRRKWL